MKNILKIFLSCFCLRMEKIYNKGPIIIQNVFKTSFQRKVLISYIQAPFIEGIKFHHSNYLECLTSAEIFNNHGYQVDVIQFDYEGAINYDHYNIIYGMGMVYENSFYSGKTDQKRIFYGTGCCPIYSNIETTRKLISFYKKNKLLLPESARLVKEALTLTIFASDAIIVLGNKFVLETYKMYENKIGRYYSLNAFYFDIYNIDFNQKDFDTAKKHFLWFGSSGLLHKGLDILIEIFSSHENIILHICGASPNEKRFFEYYQSKIEESSNIIIHGFVDINSEEFKNLMDICGFAVFPTVSEGNAPSLLNVMANGGLIPIVSKSCGIDIGEMGWEIENIDKKEFEKAILIAHEQDSNILKGKALKIKQEMLLNYNYETYKINLDKIIENIIEPISN